MEDMEPVVARDAGWNYLDTASLGTAPKRVTQKTVLGKSAHYNLKWCGNDDTAAAASLPDLAGWAGR
ncbi:hypothetical protein BP5796_08778 [Coleophoma crateriformis]|uniref:Uncharacterized protein n=1 Tax=Coleophoma crateriformis TaxID=565419 RepID=A0A3D8R920_9HELO|nr:hypothetical protein BP5796_08778 [Coleophoma crateriformis]